MCDLPPPLEHVVRVPNGSAQDPNRARPCRRLGLLTAGLPGPHPRGRASGLLPTLPPGFSAVAAAWRERGREGTTGRVRPSVRPSHPGFQFRVASRLPVPHSLPISEVSGPNVGSCWIL